MQQLLSPPIEAAPLPAFLQTDLAVQEWYIPLISPPLPAARRHDALSVQLSAMFPIVPPYRVASRHELPPKQLLSITVMLPPSRAVSLHAVLLWQPFSIFVICPPSRAALEQVEIPSLQEDMISPMVPLFAANRQAFNQCKKI